MQIKLTGDEFVVPGSVEDLANRIFMCAVIGANALRGASDKPISRTVWLSIVFEYVFFYIVLAGRKTWAHLPVENQGKRTSELSHVLLTSAVDYVFEDGDTAGNADRVEYFKAELESRTKEYNRYDVMLRESESEPSEGTALMAFCNKVTALAGAPRDMAGIMTAHAHIYDSLGAVGAHG